MMSSGRLDSADWRLATRAQSIGGVLGSMHARGAFGLVCRPTSIVRAMGGRRSGMQLYNYNSCSCKVFSLAGREFVSAWSKVFMTNAIY